ncbi:MAG: hypothetical protein H7288_13745 [Kineosporiaceae bacterium]|nr:hypothetical protein [Aeromicrobium sp.]
MVITPMDAARRERRDGFLNPATLHNAQMSFDGLLCPTGQSTRVWVAGHDGLFHTAFGTIVPSWQQ